MNAKKTTKSTDSEPIRDGIPDGFDLIHKQNDFALYGALRNRYYHFISDFGPDTPLRHNHVPRYSLAAAALKNETSAFPYGTVYLPEEITRRSGFGQMGLALTSDKKHALVVHRWKGKFKVGKQPSVPLTEGISAIVCSNDPSDVDNKDGVPLGIVCRLVGKNAAEFAKRISSDARTLEKARKEVALQKKLYRLKSQIAGSYTWVAHKSKELVEAIAFERETLGDIDKSRFGLYSAFCTYNSVNVPPSNDDTVLRDIGPRPKPEPFKGKTQGIHDILSDLPDRWSSIYNRYSNDILRHPFGKAWLETLKRLPGKIIMGVAGFGGKQEGQEILEDAVRKLNNAQVALMVLMFGMHDADPLTALSLIYGTLDYEDYGAMDPKEKTYKEKMLDDIRRCEQFDFDVEAYVGDQFDRYDDPDDLVCRSSEAAYLHLFGELAKAVEVSKENTME